MVKEKAEVVTVCDHLKKSRKSAKLPSARRSAQEGASAVNRQAFS
jgi:hypothetical protein